MKTTTTNPTVRHLFSILMLIACTFMLLPSVSDAAVVGRFTLVEGTVDLLKGGSLPAVPARVDLSVEEKDVIRTKSASRAEIVMADKTILRVAQRSRIDISEYSADPAKKNIVKLDRGKVEAVVDKKPVSRISAGARANSFEIHTPNAVAGVRGTNFFMSYIQNVSVTLVKLGNVCVFNQTSPDYEVCIPPDYLTSVSGRLHPEPPRAATKADFNNFEKDFRGVSSGGANGAPGGPVSLAALPPASTPLPPVTVVPPVYVYVPPTVPDNSPSYPVTAEGAFYETVDITGTGSVSISNSTASISLNGTYANSEPSDNWIMNVVTTGPTGPFGEVDLTGTQWSNNVLAATAAGYWIDTAPATPATGIYIGETSGTFNPANSTWQTVVNGSWLETNQYLARTATPAGQAELTALNIPAYEVGRIDLAGSIFTDGDPGSDYVSVVMNDVIFFAPSNGAKPGIWATNNITGGYDFTNNSGLNATTILLPENMITLEDGDAISANFQFTQWQGNKWAGKVTNGTGTLTNGGSSYTGPAGNAYTGPVNFKGGAAGNLTGTTSGTLSGTGAGVVK